MGAPIAARQASPSRLAASMECKGGGKAIGRSHGDIAQPYLYMFWRRSGTFHASCTIAPPASKSLLSLYRICTVSYQSTYCFAAMCCTVLLYNACAMPAQTLGGVVSELDGLPTSGPDYRHTALLASATGLSLGLSRNMPRVAPSTPAKIDCWLDSRCKVPSI